MRFKALAMALGCAPLLMATLPVTVQAKPAQGQAHRISGLRVIPLTIVSQAGSRRRTYRFRVELAQTGEQQARGLMFRAAMGANEGMIFPMKPPRTAAFWMHNTVLPLDLIFIGPAGRIITIAADAVPYSDAQIASGGIVKGVLELNAGRAAALGLRVGDKVSW